LDAAGKLKPAKGKAVSSTIKLSSVMLGWNDLSCLRFKATFGSDPYLRMKLVHSFFIFAVVILTTTGAGAVEVTVFAAASLSDACTEIAPLFFKATGDTLRFNFGASGALTRQIKEGAPVDVIFSADELRVDQLERAGLLLPDTRRTLLANTLVVVIAAEDSVLVKTLGDLAKAEVRRIAIGEPATVPAGTYTKDYLQKIGDWSRLTGKLVPLDTVRAALAAVETGNAEAGFVYKTDALVSKKVEIAFEVPFVEGPKIIYPIAILKDAKQPKAARALLDFLAGVEAQKVFAKYGFLTPN
jgi:molybdate transport system substrate-binding protein